MTGSGSEPLGVVLAGGASRRFGSHKALASFHGEPLWRRASRVLRQAHMPVLLLANDPEVAGAVTVPVRGDLRPGRGPLAGIETGLLEARERELAGVVVLACDLVLVETSMVERLLAAWTGTGVVTFVAPGPWGLSPLCAVWSLDVLPDVTEALDRGRGSPGALLSDVEVRTVSLRDGNPERVFRSVNTPGDLTDLESDVDGPDGTSRVERGGDA